MNIHVVTLLLVTLVWGATFPVLKLSTEHLSGLEVSALRFLVAALVMLPFAIRAPRQAWRDGGILGGIVLVSYVAQAYGLEHISSNRSAFLTSLNVLMVPLLGIMGGVRPTRRVGSAAGLACVGIGLMSWEGGSHLWADAATVLGALAYALDVIILSRWAGRHSALHLASTQIVWMAVLGAGWMVLNAGSSDQLATLPDRLNLGVVAALLFLGGVATAGMLFLQAVAQRYVSANKAALVYAMEPVFATVFAWWVLGEALGNRAALGGTLVVLAVMLGAWPTEPRSSKTATQA